MASNQVRQRPSFCENIETLKQALNIRNRGIQSVTIKQTIGSIDNKFIRDYRNDQSEYHPLKSADSTVGNVCGIVDFLDLSSHSRDEIDKRLKARLCLAPANGYLPRITWKLSVLNINNQEAICKQRTCSQTSWSCREQRPACFPNYLSEHQDSLTFTYNDIRSFIRSDDL